MEYINAVVIFLIIVGIFLLMAGIGILAGKLLKKKAAENYYDYREK